MASKSLQKVICSDIMVAAESLREAPLQKVFAATKIVAANTCYFAATKKRFCSDSKRIYTAENSFGDLSNKVVADFGCVCGTLGLAAALLSAEHVFGIDIDPESLEIAALNSEELELYLDLIQSSVMDLGWRGQIVDTVVMNPPFGTRKKGVDMDFLHVALKHVKRATLRDFNACSAEVLCELRYDVPKLYKFHKKKEVDIAVDLWRFVPANHQSRDT